MGWICLNCCSLFLDVLLFIKNHLISQNADNEAERRSDEPQDKDIFFKKLHCCWLKVWQLMASVFKDFSLTLILTRTHAHTHFLFFTPWAWVNPSNFMKRENIKCMSIPIILLFSRDWQKPSVHQRSLIQLIKLKTTIQTWVAALCNPCGGVARHWMQPCIIKKLTGRVNTYFLPASPTRNVNMKCRDLIFYFYRKWFDLVFYYAS